MKWAVAFIELLLLAAMVTATFGVLSTPNPVWLQIVYALLGTACSSLIGYFIYDIVRD